MFTKISDNPWALPPKCSDPEHNPPAHLIDSLSGGAWLWRCEFCGETFRVSIGSRPPEPSE